MLDHLRNVSKGVIRHPFSGYFGIDSKGRVLVDNSKGVARDFFVDEEETEGRQSMASHSKRVDIEIVNPGGARIKRISRRLQVIWAAESLAFHG